jgi:hypothetical protein
MPGNPAMPLIDSDCSRSGDHQAAAALNFNGRICLANIQTRNIDVSQYNRAVEIER